VARAEQAEDEVHQAVVAPKIWPKMRAPRATDVMLGSSAVDAPEGRRRGSRWFRHVREEDGGDQLRDRRQDPRSAPVLRSAFQNEVRRTGPDSSAHR
jgi:hypothetical protein